jgi:hypothetical protein
MWSMLFSEATSAAAGLAINEWRPYRLLAVDEDGGGSGLIHKARGRESNHSLNPGIQKYAVELVRTKYDYFGPSLVWRF